MPPLWTRQAPRRVVAAVFVALLFALRAEAAEPAKPIETPKLTEAARRGWLRARIVSGRIAFGGTRLGSMNDTTEDGGRKEHVSIGVAGRELTVSYEMSTPDEEFSLKITGDDQLHIRRTPKGDSGLVPVDFRQSPDEPLRLSWGPKEEGHVCQAASLWHLLIMEPAACRQHLVPLLQVLDAQWDLNSTAEDVERALVRAAADGALPDPRRWAALVDELGDERFSRREAADRELRALGRVVLTYLNGLDLGKLDAEQRYRVRRIILTLSASIDNDTPPEIAKWLAGDPVVWLAMLSRDDESTRRLAAERLEALLGEPIEFDPGADGQTRADQIERLRARLPAQ